MDNLLNRTEPLRTVLEPKRFPLKCFEAIASVVVFPSGSPLKIGTFTADHSTHGTVLGLLLSNAHCLNEGSEKQCKLFLHEAFREPFESWMSTQNKGGCPHQKLCLPKELRTHTHTYTHTHTSEWPPLCPHSYT